MTYLDKVLNLFINDLKLFPTNDHIKVEKLESTKYHYILQQKEFDLFENLELIDHDQDHKTFIFWTKSFSINNIKELVSTFYRLFGNDHISKGLFNDEDFAEIVEQNFWMGRLWGDEKYKCAVMISLDTDESKLDLCLKW